MFLFTKLNLNSSRAQKPSSCITKPTFMAATTMAQQGCTLLSLPPEIRNIIYELALKLEGDPLGIVDIKRAPRSGNNINTCSVHALLQTCKQLYAEASGIFYTINHVAIGYLPVKAFLKTMSASHLSYLKRLAIKGKRPSIHGGTSHRSSNGVQRGASTQDR